MNLNKGIYMEYIYKRLTFSDLNNCAKQFILSFQESPWNETWTYEQAVSRLSEIMSSDVSRGFVIYDGEQVVSTLCGRIMTYMDEREFWIDDFSVHPHYQGQGIGKKMLMYIEKELVHDCVDKLMLNTMRGYECQSFYEKQGFTLEPNMIIMSKK